MNRQTLGYTYPNNNMVIVEIHRTSLAFRRVLRPSHISIFYAEAYPGDNIKVLSRGPGQGTGGLGPFLFFASHFLVSFRHDGVRALKIPEKLSCRTRSYSHARQVFVPLSLNKVKKILVVFVKMCVWTFFMLFVFSVTVCMRIFGSWVKTG